MIKYLFSTIFNLLILSNSFALDFYVSSTATGSGNGSFGDPWLLQQALNAPAAIKNPKDTIWVWVKGGTYVNNFDIQSSFSCFTNGTASAPIIFRNYNNERATIDGNLTYTLAFSIGNCSYTWFWGIEVLNSDTSDRDYSNKNRLGNIYCTAPNIKFINMIIHDMGSGLDLWKTSSNSESYGCLIYNIGNNLLNGTNWEGHGHGMYLQNDTIGIKNIHNNIIFNTYGYGVKIWQTTTTDAIGNFDVQRNIVFNGGAASDNLGGVGNNSRTHNFFVVSNSVNNPIRNTVIKHNYTYAGTNIPRPPVNAFGLNYGVDNMTLDSNYLTCQIRLGFNNTPIFKASVKGNKIIAGIPSSYGYYLWGFTDTDFPQNTFSSNTPTSGLEYYFLPNKYEKGRTHLVVYNWDSTATIQINVANANLKTGDIIEIVNVMDYYEDVLNDTVDINGKITIPMINHTFATVIGSKKPPVSQFPIFGTFVIRKIGKTTTGISGNRNISKLHIFPNPTCSNFNVNFSITHSGFYEVKVIDISGKTVLSRTHVYFEDGNQEIQIDTKNFENGIYIIKIEGQQTAFIGKLIINK